jgi:hypothetical protein
MSGNFADKWRIPRQMWGFFTCRKSATWDRRLYFPSEGRHAEDFLALKNPTVSAGLEPAHLSTRGRELIFSTEGLYYFEKWDSSFMHAFIQTFIYSFTHTIVCFTTGSKPLLKLVLHIVQHNASLYNFHYFIFSVSSPGSCVPRLSRLPVTSILPAPFPSKTCFKLRFIVRCNQTIFYCMWDIPVFIDSM